MNIRANLALAVIAAVGSGVAAAQVPTPIDSSTSAYSRAYVQKAYVAYYGRPADPAGLNYWAARMDAEGQSLNAIIGAFGTSPEFKGRYGGLTYTQLVTKIYQQALGRAPDQAGLDYYVAELQAGRRTLQAITLDVLNGATTAPDATVVANKLGIASYFSTEVATGCPYGTEHDGVSALAGVTDLAATATAARSAIDTRCGLAAVFTPRGAARLLQQGTWGASLAEISRVAGLGAEAWLAEQFATPATSYTAHAEWNIAQNKLGANDCTGMNMQSGCPWQVNLPAFYKQAFVGSDQLRQRVANALLQIMVISVANNRVQDAGTAMPSYLDMLGRNGFGNFRDLLRDVTLHPGMGFYLDMMGSSREVPNENYAREMLQLFSVGTVLLNDDGTVLKDAQGKSIPTYGEDVVQGFARAFTGWHMADQDMTKSWKFYWPDEKWTVPMKPWTARRCPQDGHWPPGNVAVWCNLNNPATSYPPPHEPDTKKLLQYAGAPFANLPAGQTPEMDIENAIDNVFHHPNVGPFVVKQLIQRLVTSNPSPAYVRRVVTVFNDNGNHVRGDMKAVLRSILLDGEARSATVAAGNAFGKLREPVVKFLHLHRAFNARTDSGYYNIWDLSGPDKLGQEPLRAPSVFNYYGADFAPAGPITEAGLVGPEFEITTTAAVAGFSDFAQWGVYGGFGRNASAPWTWVKPNYDRYVTGAGALADNPQALVEELDLLLTAGNLKAPFKSDLVAVLNKVTRDASADQRSERFRVAFWQIINSAEYAVQR